jgi:hypothetical protein
LQAFSFHVFEIIPEQTIIAITLLNPFPQIICSQSNLRVS